MELSYGESTSSLLNPKTVEFPTILTFINILEVVDTCQYPKHAIQTSQFKIYFNIFLRTKSRFCELK
jgi:hypothetical protein